MGQAPVWKARGGGPQTVPNRWEAERWLVYEQVGNVVPPALAEAVAAPSCGVSVVSCTDSRAGMPKGVHSQRLTHLAWIACDVATTQQRRRP